MNDPILMSPRPRLTTRLRAAFLYRGRAIPAAGVGVAIVVALWCTRQPTAPTALQSIRAEPDSHPVRPFMPIDWKSQYAWLSNADRRTYAPLLDRIGPPPGFSRVAVQPGSFADWLRHFPVAPVDAPVKTARNKIVYPAGHPRVAAVLALQPRSERALAGSNILVRLRAEYLWSAGHRDQIAFHFTSGHLASWVGWSAGQRPQVRGQRVAWEKSASPDDSRDSYCGFLETLFQYASPYSLLKDTLESVGDPPAPGDLFLTVRRSPQAALIIDVATDSRGRLAILIAQGGSPAQTLHILRGSLGGAWFEFNGAGPLALDAKTRFTRAALRRWR